MGSEKRTRNRGDEDDEGKTVKGMLVERQMEKQGGWHDPSISGEPAPAHKE